MPTGHRVGAASDPPVLAPGARRAGVGGVDYRNRGRGDVLRMVGVKLNKTEAFLLGYGLFCGVLIGAFIVAVLCPC